MKRCPFCDEEIRDKAIKCKHCKSDLPIQNEVQEIELDDFRLKPLEKIAFDKRRAKAKRYKGTKYAKCSINSSRIERHGDQPSFLDSFHGWWTFLRFFNRHCFIEIGAREFELMFGNNMKAIEANFAIHYDNEGYEEEIEYLNSGYYDKIHRTENGLLYYDRYNGNDKKIMRQELKYGDHDLTKTEQNPFINTNIDRQISHTINMYDLILAEKIPSLNNIPTTIDVYDVMGKKVERFNLEIYSDGNHTIINDVLDRYNKSFSRCYKYNENGTIDGWEDHFSYPQNEFDMNYTKEGDKMIAEYYVYGAYNTKRTYMKDLLIERKVYGIKTEGVFDREVEVVQDLTKVEYDSKQRIKSIVEQDFQYETQLFGKDEVKINNAEFNFEYQNL
tara:strand:- start:649 stop:1812 length:1164 start_codon:yes stop_codon:yes gene_type:complete